MEQFHGTVPYFYPHFILKSLVLQAFQGFLAAAKNGQPMTTSLKLEIEKGGTAAFELLV